MRKGMRAAIPAAIVSAIAATAVAACSSSTAKPDDAAAQAAQEYYDSLKNGGYDFFTDMHHQPESIPASYREQLVTNTKMFWSELNKLHGGVSEVRVANCISDSLHSTANAFLLLCFSDSTKEEIVVPMIKVNDRWMMK